MPPKVILKKGSFEVAFNQLRGCACIFSLNNATFGGMTGLEMALFFFRGWLPVTNGP